MPRPTTWTRRLLRRRAWDEWDGGWEGGLADEGVSPRGEDVEPEPAPPTDARARSRRLAKTLVFATLFFAGAALSAGAGDQMRHFLAGDEATSASEEAHSLAASTTEMAGVDEPLPAESAKTPSPEATSDGSDAAPAPEESEPPAFLKTPSPSEAAPPAPAPEAAHKQPAAESGTVEKQAKPSATATLASHPRAKTQKRAVRRTAKPKAKPRPVELEGAGAATVWLNRAMPDPTPPALRLTPRFAVQLRRTSKKMGVDWALVLAVLRAKGNRGSVPSGPWNLRVTAGRLAALGGARNPWSAAVAFSGETGFADRTVALANYYRAVGLRGLVKGMLGVEKELRAKVLADPRVRIYGGGRSDIATGHVNVRVVVLIEYLANTFGSVDVSCLVSGHRLYARPGVISAHIYGLAADISALGGVSITGHQQPGSVTERAVRAILLLPGGMLPRQVISLLGLGGPSFPLANHYDHIHVGY
jgi:hypothetical protein